MPNDIYLYQPIEHAKQKIAFDEKSVTTILTAMKNVLNAETLANIDYNELLNLPC